MAVDRRRLTRRPLPEEDATIAALDAPARRDLAEVWARRAQAELETASAFSLLVAELHEIAAPMPVLRIASRSAHDEVRHAELCRLLAEAYAGADVPPPIARRVRLRRHEVARPLEVALHVTTLACINESIASSFVQQCLDAAEAPLVHAIQTEHLTDEIDHARVGWAHLAQLDASDKRALTPHLAVLVRDSLAAWRTSLERLPESGVPAHGYPARPLLWEGARRAVLELVVPGLAHVGVDAAGVHAVASSA